MFFFVPAFILSVTGWLVKYRKMTWLISGYNTSPKAERESYDIEKLCHYTGTFIFVLAGISFALAFAITLFAYIADEIATIGLFVYIFTIGCGLVYLNTDNRLKKKR